MEPILDESQSKSGIDITVLEEDLDLCRKEQGVIFRKCRCNSSWCPKCGLRAIQERMAEIYTNWRYKYVRTYVLTVDRNLYESGKEAYFSIQREKKLAEFMRSLKKKLFNHGIRIFDYIWILEWHPDGFPHWHCLVLINKKGKAGRMAYKVDLKEIWGKARAIKEGYIHNEIHWKRLGGYVAKHGYFGDGKKEQGRLPGWALELQKSGPEKIRIKRMERMRRDLREGKRGKRGRIKFTEREKQVIARLDEIFNVSIFDEESGECEPLSGEPITWGECLKNCGAKTLMTIQNKVFYLTMRIGLPYDEIKEMGGDYWEGVGWVNTLDSETILNLAKMGDEIIYYNRVEFDTFDDLEKKVEIEIDPKPKGMEQIYIPF